MHDYVVFLSEGGVVQVHHLHRVDGDGGTCKNTPMLKSD